MPGDAPAVPTKFQRVRAACLEIIGSPAASALSSPAKTVLSVLIVLFLGWSKEEDRVATNRIAFLAGWWDGEEEFKRHTRRKVSDALKEIAAAGLMTYLPKIGRPSKDGQSMSIIRLPIIGPGIGRDEVQLVVEKVGQSDAESGRISDANWTSARHESRPDLGNLGNPIPHAARSSGGGLLAAHLSDLATKRHAPGAKPGWVKFDEGGGRMFEYNAAEEADRVAAFVEKYLSTADCDELLAIDAAPADPEHFDWSPASPLWDRYPYSERLKWPSAMQWAFDSIETTGNAGRIAGACSASWADVATPAGQIAEHIDDVFGDVNSEIAETEVFAVAQRMIESGKTANSPTYFLTVAKRVASEHGIKWSPLAQQAA
jgi:hypothetical protein